MNRIAATESTALFIFTAGSGLTIFAAGAAMMLRFRNSDGASLLFLVFAFIGCLVTLLAYRRYKALRDERWKREMKASEDALNQVLSHARMNIIVDHVTGPLDTTKEDAEPDTEAAEGQTIGKP